MSSKKLPVCINVFPTLDYVELVQYDEKTGEIDKASSLPCQFDQSSRQMTDRDLMSQAIRDLYNMNRIPFNTPAVLVLPSFFTREIELPTEFTKDELRFALIFEAERFYIFKKVEPHIDWINLDETRLLYSAFPKTEIEKYVNIFQELRIPLMSIELSYFSIMRGLVATGAVAEELEAHGRWCLMVISDYSFYASIQEGVKIIKTTDSPLSVTTEDDQAMINEIQQDFETFSEAEAFGKLIVVNNSNRISSESLLSRLSYQGSLILIEQNALTLRSRGATEGQFPCALEGIGGIFYHQLPELPHMNFLPKTGEDVVGILHYKKRAFIWLLIANAAVFFLCLAVWGVMSLIIWQKDQERELISRQTAELGTLADAQQLSEISRKKFIKKVVDQNVALNNFLVTLGSSTSNDVWLERVQLTAEKPDGPLEIMVEGRALELEKVNDMQAALVRNLKNMELEVTNAAQEANEEGQNYFTWTIQNKGAGAQDGSGGPASGGLAPGGGPMGGHR